MTTTIKNSNLSAEINPFGAELISLKSNNNKEYIWEGNQDFWGKHSPVLFPIVGTLKNNSFLYEGTQYQLSRHGFARDMTFELIEKKLCKLVEQKMIIDGRIYDSLFIKKTIRH